MQISKKWKAGIMANHGNQLWQIKNGIPAEEIICK